MMKSLLKVSLLSALSSLLRIIVGFVVFKVIALYTGPSGMAMVGQVQSMIVAFNGVINSPAGNGVVRYTAEMKAQGYNACSEFWRAALLWICILSIVVIPLGVFFSTYLAEVLLKNESYSWIILLTVCLLPLSAIGVLNISVINGQQNYNRYFSLGILSTLISAIVTTLMIVLGHINGAFVAVSIQSATAGVIMILANFRQPWFKRTYWIGAVEKSSMKKIGGYILMAITSALTVPIALICVRTFIIDFHGWEAAGQWQAVWKISEVYLGVITLGLATYYLPKLSSITGVDLIVKEINKTVLIVLPVVCALATIIYFLRDVIILILFTEEFSAARDLFLIQLLGDVVKIISFLYVYPMISRGATKWYVATEVLFSLSFIFFSYIFIQKFALQGASLAYLVNYSLYFIFMFVNVKRFSA